MLTDSQATKLAAERIAKLEARLESAWGFDLRDDLDRARRYQTQGEHGQ